MSSEGDFEKNTTITSYKSLHEIGSNNGIGGVSTSDVNIKPTNISLQTGGNDDNNEYNNGDISSDDDNMLIMTGFNAPTPRSPDDDIALALQETTNDSFCEGIFIKLISSCCGCCCCCVYTSSAQQSTQESSSRLDINYVSESSETYWIKYPFMRTAHRMWKIYFLCYLLLAIPFIYLSQTIYSTSCSNSDINNALGDVIDMNDSSSNFCNLYYWIYIWLSPFLFLIVTYITERVTLHNDMRGDRLTCLLNIVCLVIIIYLFVFFNYINKLLMDNICIDYQSSQSKLLINGCKGISLHYY